MMRYLYNPSMDKAIIENEERWLRRYSDFIKDYEEAFAKYNSTLNVELHWKTSSKEKGTLERPLFKKGYLCFVSCEVRRNGKVIRYNNHDGEVDYYELSMSWLVTEVRQIFRCYVEMYSGLGDVVEFLEHFLEILASKDIDFISY